MATSSLNHNFYIKDKKRAEAFADSLERAEKAAKNQNLGFIQNVIVTDKNELKKLLRKRIVRTKHEF